MTQQPYVFDVLVVYSHEIAISASSKLPNTDTPFASGSGRSHYNQAYAYLLQTCARLGLKAAFASSADIVGPGQCSAFWVYLHDRWVKVPSYCFANVIFDKFSPTNKALAKLRRSLFSSNDIDAFNNPYLLKLFFDKLKSFKKFPFISIPTEAIVSKDRAGITASLKRLRRSVLDHPQKQDFGKGIILKDRYGSGGFDIYKFNANIQKNIEHILHRSPKTEFIIQPFALFDQGYEYKNKRFSTDIRIIFMGSKIVQVYIRNAKSGDFRCNEHQGGMLTYVDKNDIPKKVISAAQNIADNLDQAHSLYALDFIISNSGQVYFLEGNSGPGIDWNLKLPKNEHMSKKLIRIIVQELHNRVTSSALCLKNKYKPTSFLPSIHYLS